MQRKQGIINPVAKAMLQQRKPPQIVLPKKGNKAKRSRANDFRKVLTEAMEKNYDWWN